MEETQLPKSATQNLYEKNVRTINRLITKGDDVNRFSESMKRKYGLDMFDEKKFPVMEDNFSFKKLRESVRAKFKEDDNDTTFTQFLRAGVNVLAVKGYQMQQTTYEAFVKVIGSKRATELYAPNHGPAFPREVPEGGIYPQVGQAALNLSLPNRKYGSMYVCTKELIDDDQTGQIQEGATQLGQYLKILTEVLCYGKLASVANMSYADFQIPTSETFPTTGYAAYPWATAANKFPGGGYTRPNTYGLPGVTTFNAAQVALMNQKNLQGLKMGIVPNVIIHGPQLQFDIATLLNSQWYPVGASAAGVVGGAFANNPVKALYTPICSPFVFKNDGTVNGDSKAWYITDNTKPAFVLQMRDGIAVSQENPLSGDSFDSDVVRFKGTTRQNADFIDPRFFWQGNDGSVTS